VNSHKILVCAACLLGISLAGCTTRGPASVRFPRYVNQAELEQLPKLTGSIVLLADADFWTDKQGVSRIPIARRGKSMIIGPGATEMADKMLTQMFDDVVEVRALSQVMEPERYEFVIRLVHGPFDGGTFILPLVSRQRYRVEIGAEVSRRDGTFIDRVDAEGSESFWLVSLGEASPFEGDERLLKKASTTLNAALQETLFELMDELAELPAFSSGGDHD
jgi:hypothetical protein